MVAFVFNVWGFTYQDSLATMVASYAAATKALSDRVSDIQAEVRKYEAHVAAGGDQIGEWDEDGYRIWDHSQVLEIQLDSAVGGSESLRKAYAILGYHHWERAAAQWSELENKNHDRLVEGSIAKGYPVHEHLKAVRDLV